MYLNWGSNILSNSERKKSDLVRELLKVFFTAGGTELREYTQSLLRISSASPLRVIEFQNKQAIHF